MKHPCEIIYEYGNKPVYGNDEGICRITGKRAKGIKFDLWVKKTFTDWANLFEGEIISNEALFCFEEKSDYLKELTGKEKPQRFRSYTHIVANCKWYILTKAQKQEIYKLLIEHDPIIAVISDSGQKHLLFKHKIGTWQFENEHIARDKKTLREIKELSDELLNNGFSKKEIISGNYSQNRIWKFGLNKLLKIENKLKTKRGSAIFDFAVWLSQKTNED